MFFSRPAGQKLIPRGDRALDDLSLEDFVRDGGWHDLSLEDYVPINAKWVFIKVDVDGIVAGDSIIFRKKGNTTNVMTAYFKVNIADTLNSHIHPIEIGSDRMIEYFATPALTLCNFVVYGWVI